MLLKIRKHTISAQPASQQASQPHNTHGRAGATRFTRASALRDSGAQTARLLHHASTNLKTEVGESHPWIQ
jgi:hypothetical protein